MRIWIAAVVVLAVGCNRPDAAVDSYVNDRMQMPLSRMEDGMHILRAIPGSLGDKTDVSPELIHAAKTLHAASAAMATITPPPAFKTAHESYGELSEMIAKNFDGMVDAAKAHDDSTYTRTYTAALTTFQTVLSTDRLWEQLVKEAHVTPKKLPAPPAD